MDEKELNKEPEAVSEIKEEEVIVNNSLDEKMTEVINESQEESEDDSQFIIREDGVKDPVIGANEAPEDLNYESDHLSHIEEERKIFLKKYKKQNSLKWVISLIALAAVIAVWVIIPNVAKDQSWAMPVMISSIVGILALLLLYTFWVRRSINTKMRAYFAIFYDESNKFVFEQDGFANIEPQVPDKITREQFVECEMYKDIIEVGSRGLTAFEYKGIPVAVCDCAGQVKTEKRIAPVFVGKFLFAASNYESDEPIIVYLKGDKRALPPTNVDDKKAVHDDDKFIVWTNNSNWEKVIDSKFKKVLNKVNLSNDLVDLAISFTKGRMFIAMGYDDPLMVLPLEKPYNPNPVKIYKKDMAVIAEFFPLFNKTK